ncbi:MAG: class I SAM-dependent methyltransferase [Peptococcaceae bacterium]|jgi:predicted methyltransferase|nr:methyltransferase domain-containing protein [Peptococcaceae bacterium]MDH7525332.1 class I SAM-dependent methyltransferase [Peptococcaceae bacterium]
MNETLRATGVCHLLLGRLLAAGQTVVDATAGNGKDTLFLAKAVGKSGKVYAFDIQAEALEKTRSLLEAHRCLEQVELIHDSHEKINDYLAEPVNGFIFNLGYLPGGDKRITTAAGTTINALRQAVERTAPGGIIAVVVYPGHPGGEEEARETEEFLSNLVSPYWHVLAWKKLNGEKAAPALIVAYRQA